MRTCDGSDDGLIMYVGIDGTPMDDPEFAAMVINCDCGTMFDDTKHELTWPHRYLPPARPERLTNDLPDIAGFL